MSVVGHDDCGVEFIKASVPRNDVIENQLNFTVIQVSSSQAHGDKVGGTFQSPMRQMATSGAEFGVGR